MADVVTILLIDYILLIRVLALFHQDKRLSIILKTLLSLEACTGIGILIYDTLFEGVIIGSLAEGMTICGQSRFFRTLGTVSWVVPMAYGTILLVLALYKAAEYWKLSSGFKGFHLVRVLIQDQVMYYGFVIFCSACQIVENSVQGINPFLANVLAVAGSPTLLCILGGQLLINLKEAGERGANGGTNYSLSSVSDIDFGENDAVHEQGTGLERSTETEDILAIRVLALYHQDRRLAFFLGFLFVLDAASDLGMLIYGYMFEGTTIQGLANGDTICTYSRSPPQVVGIISWCVPMTYGFILLGLALYKAKEYWKLAAGFKGFNLVKILVLDQVMIYSAVIFCSVLKIMYNRIFDDNRFASDLLNAAGSPVLLSVLGGYLLVPLKEAAELGFNEGTSYRLKSVSAIEFL
ncbi:hypothetical protein A7U60_g9138 [Sanghuangporus baumii]|uniref:Uncharacterized protein n=1 Tax=Sanghuangporus baumii TaxID=108892 RepID=A0A9Q5N7R1_SANBA|nr:hypothetical protein A7U60_g9138 [Sanghuangporus baumii]